MTSENDIVLRSRDVCRIAMKKIPTLKCGNEG